MPGILPMKVIKVGGNAQSRIAQACDRCRSKKIRCDGIRPSCSQCISVGFECKTSDKLSRRAFPRGYTESLEERVRQLEQEVRELKELLDEKDEKIDILSRLHSHASASGSGSGPESRRPSAASPIIGTDGATHSGNHESASMQSSPPRHDAVKVIVPYSATSLPIVEEELVSQRLSGIRPLIECVKSKLRDRNRPFKDIDTDAFVPLDARIKMSNRKTAVEWSFPPRMAADQMINIFFQEWAPLFPVLHRPTFLALYDKGASNRAIMEDKYLTAQLSLVFCIAASSDEESESLATCEMFFSLAIASFAKDKPSLPYVQSLALAQLYCIRKGDYPNLTRYRSLAVEASRRLHLQKRSSGSSYIANELRRRVFWTLYTLDAFSAACLGQPRLFSDDHITCGFPSAVDDEYITEKGIGTAPQAEGSKLSGALALFRVSRVLGRVLDENYPADSTYELTMQGIQELSEALDSWQAALPAHLRLVFEHDKPSTKIINDRCPLIALTYHYIRLLIYRPVVCSGLNDKTSAAMMKIAQSSKCVVQILQLLEERNLAMSLCLNYNELLLTSGFSLMLHTLELDDASKSKKDSQRVICSIIELLSRRNAPFAHEFKRIGCSMLAVRKAWDSSESASASASPLSVYRAPSLGVLSSPCLASTPQHSDSPRSFTGKRTHGGIEDIARRYSIATGRALESPTAGFRSGLQQASDPALSTSKRKSRFQPIAPSLGSSAASSIHNSPGNLHNESMSPLSASNASLGIGSNLFKARSQSTSAHSASSLNLDFFSFSDDTMTQETATPPAPAPASGSQRSDSASNEDLPDWDNLLKCFNNANIETAIDDGDGEGDEDGSPTLEDDDDSPTVSPINVPTVVHAPFDASPTPDDPANTADHHITSEFDGTHEDFLAYLQEFTLIPDQTAGSKPASMRSLANNTPANNDASTSLSVLNSWYMTQGRAGADAVGALNGAPQGTLQDSGSTSSLDLSAYAYARSSSEAAGLSATAVSNNARDSAAAAAAAAAAAMPSPAGTAPASNKPQSLLSLSDESLTSGGEDFSSIDFESSHDSDSIGAFDNRLTPWATTDSARSVGSTGGVTVSSAAPSLGKSGAAPGAPTGKPRANIIVASSAPLTLAAKGGHGKNSARGRKLSTGGR